MEAQNFEFDLSEREQMFADAYLLTLSKTKAGKAVGFTGNYVGQQGYEMFNRPNVKAYIDAMLKASHATADEVVKLVSDTAKSNISDYYKPVKKLKTVPVEAHLSYLIQREKDFIEKRLLFAVRKGLSDEAYDAFYEELEPRRDAILEWEIELEANPLATQIIDSEPFWVEEMELDIAALVADKRKGKIKKIKQNRDGSVEVELLNADAAHERLMKMHGLYGKDNERTVTVKGSISPDKWLEDNTD